MNPEEREKKRREQEDADLRFVLDQAQGRRLLARIIEECGVYESVLRERKFLPLVAERVLFNAGSQNLGNWLLDQAAKVNPKGFQLMYGERYSKKIEEENDGRRGSKPDPRSAG